MESVDTAPRRTVRRHTGSIDVTAIRNIDLNFSQAVASATPSLAPSRQVSQAQVSSQDTSQGVQSTDDEPCMPVQRQQKRYGTKSANFAEKAEKSVIGRTYRRAATMGAIELRAAARLANRSGSFERHAHQSSSIEVVRIFRRSQSDTTWISGSKATEAVKKIASLSEDVELRALTVSQVMRNGAAVLGSNKGGENTYDMSSIVDEVAYFLSHNWIVSRWIKLAVLAMYFNLLPATLMALTVILALSGLQLVLGSPTIAVNDQLTPTGEWSVICATCGPITLLLGLCSVHEIRARLGWRGPRVFLDKCCIHQTDEDLKRKGIENLAGVLTNSQRLLVVLTPHYLRKLWTVYELATFLTMKAPDNIVVMSPWLLKLWLGVLVAYQATVCTFWIPYKDGADGALSEAAHRVLLGCVIMPGQLALAIIARMVRRGHQETLDELYKFNIERATCFVDEDREKIKYNIEMFMRAHSLVFPNETQEEIMETFADVVRHHVGDLIVASSGRNMFRYRDVLSAGIASVGVAFDSLVVDIQLGQPPRVALLMFAKYMWLWLVWIPMLTAAMTRAGGFRLEWRGYMAGCYVLLVGICGAVASSLALIAVRFVQSWAETSNLGIAIAVLLFAASFCVVAWVFRKPNPKPSLMESLKNRRFEVHSSATTSVARLSRSMTHADPEDSGTDSCTV